MASVEKRAHVPTKRMQEYLKMRYPHEGEDGGGGSFGIPQVKLLHCPVTGCDKVLTSSPGLRYHIKTHDSHQGSYVCNKCKKHFRSSNGLKYHLGRTKCDSSGSEQEMEEEIIGCDLMGETDVLHTDTEFGSTPVDVVGEDSQDQVLEGECEQRHDWLRELAIIATGPQSPLLPKNNPLSTSSAVHHMDRNLHSYARPPRSRTPSPRPPSPPPSLIRPPVTRPRSKSMGDTANSRLQEDMMDLSPEEDIGEDHEDLPYSWPSTAWHCFMQGVTVRFLSGPTSDWQTSDDLSLMNNPFIQGYGSQGLRVLTIEEVQGPGVVTTFLRLRLSPDLPGQTEIIAQCPLDHPFFVLEKGWCSVRPRQSEAQYGMLCSMLEVGNICIPPHHPHASIAKDVLQKYKNLQFTAMDSSAVLALSNMAKAKKEQELSPHHNLSPTSLFPRCLVKPPQFKAKRDLTSFEPLRAKRPMNAFMLFAKKCRMEYMQQHPGKDNRAISVLLGDHWKRLGTEERRIYTQEAKQLAEQQKKLHPDCWKRKRTVSTGVLER